ncbi:MAG: DUF5668 domain-containing protein [Patescibacteria group bacterium]
MNEEQKSENITPVKENKKDKRRLTGPFILLAIGIFFLLENYITSFDIGKLWPVILVVIAIVMLFRRKKN